MTRRGCDTHHLHNSGFRFLRIASLLAAKLRRRTTYVRLLASCDPPRTALKNENLTCFYKNINSKTISKKDFRKNDEIRVPEVFLIDENGDKQGVTQTRDALQQAQSLGLDLVEVAPLAQPPVVKIIDFGKLQYEKEKQSRKSKSQSKKGGEIKGVRLSMNIGEHDMLVRVKSGQKFLDKNNKVKVELRLRGREKAHPELAKDVIERYIELLDRDIQIEQPIKRQGAVFSALISIKK